MSAPLPPIARGVNDQGRAFAVEALRQTPAAASRVCGSTGVDSDGHCNRCGLVPEDDAECPPGFLTAPPAKNAGRAAREDRERAMFGCTAAAIDEALAGKEPRDIAMYAMGTLSNAQELIRHDANGSWTSVDRDDANTIRQLINIAKYAMDKTVPR